MNADRRKRIASIQETLIALKDEIDGIAGEEREYHDNMPENMQGGEKGSAAEEAASMLEQAANSVDEALSALDDAAGG